MEDIPDLELRNLIRKVHSRTGIDLGQYKGSYIARRLSTRMKVLGAPTYRSYAQMLDSNTDEYDKVVDAFTINVSEFFRDKDVFKAIRENVIPAIVAEKNSTGRSSLRIWSAACACGEEVYSISMILHDVLGKDYDKFSIRLYASDIDDACMKNAQEGLYDPVSLKNVDKPFLDRFTTTTPTGKIAVTDSVKRNVTFRHYDLINGGPFGGYFDLILCRNVMIYFSEPQKKKLIAHFYDALNPGGYLVIGKTETLTTDTRTAFVPAYGLERVYRKPERSLV
jgi:chemotaxis protein methyltransferase CheR